MFESSVGGISLHIIVRVIRFLPLPSYQTCSQSGREPSCPHRTTPSPLTADVLWTAPNQVFALGRNRRSEARS